MKGNPTICIRHGIVPEMETNRSHFHGTAFILNIYNTRANRFTNKSQDSPVDKSTQEKCY